MGGNARIQVLARSIFKRQNASVLQIVRSKIKAKEMCFAESLKKRKTRAKVEKFTFELKNCIVFQARPTARGDKES